MLGSIRLDRIDLEGVGWLRLTELEVDEKKKRGCPDFLELDRFELFYCTASPLPLLTEREFYM